MECEVWSGVCEECSVKCAVCSAKWSVESGVRSNTGKCPVGAL